MKFQQYSISNKVFFCLILLFLGLMSVSVTHAETYIPIATWGSWGSDNGQFNSPCGIAVDSSGNVYVADSWNIRIQKFDSEGSFITGWSCWALPFDVAVDSSGNVYVLDRDDGCIHKFDDSGTFITSWGSMEDRLFNYPSSIAVDSSGNVYVADSGNSRIQKFDSSGTLITSWGSEGIDDGLFSNPAGIAVDFSGNVYVTDMFNHRIQKFDSNGAFITKWGSGGSEEGQFFNPSGIAVDSSDNVYVIDSGNNRVQKFDSSGTFITKWGYEGSDEGQFSYPSDVAIDSSGNVYVVEAGNARVQKFALEKTTPTITWDKPADITYGTPLGSTQLKAETSVPGTFAYNPVAGTVLPVGAHTLHVEFTPADTTRYNPTSKDVTINVQKATPTITWSNPTDIVQGTKLSITQLNAITSVPGACDYYPPSETVLSAGIQILHVDFTPTDTANYNSASKNVEINVLTPVQKIRQMNAAVQNLVISGVLTPKQGDTLTSDLNAAIKSLNDKQTKKAIRELNVFISHVGDCVQSGILTQAQGQDLIDAANSVIYVL